MKYQYIKKRITHVEEITDKDKAKLLLPKDIHFLLDYERTQVVNRVCVYETIFEAKRFPALHGWIHRRQLIKDPDIEYYDIMDDMELSYEDIMSLSKTLQEVLLDRPKAEELFPNSYFLYEDKRELVEYDIEDYYWDYAKNLYEALREITHVSGNEDDEFIYRVDEPWA